MSDDLVKQSLLELQDLVRCRCHPAYTGRGLHDPECERDSAEAVKVVADRIEELSNCIAVLEAKLSKCEALLAQQDDLIKERSDEVQAAVAAALERAATHIAPHPDHDRADWTDLAWEHDRQAWRILTLASDPAEVAAIIKKAGEDRG